MVIGYINLCPHCLHMYIEKVNFKDTLYCYTSVP